MRMNVAVEIHLENYPQIRLDVLVPSRRKDEADIDAATIKVNSSNDDTVIKRITVKSFLTLVAKAYRERRESEPTLPELPIDHLILKNFHCELDADDEIENRLEHWSKNNHVPIITDVSEHPKKRAKLIDNNDVDAGMPSGVEHFKIKHHHTIDKQKQQQKEMIMEDEDVHRRRLVEFFAKHSPEKLDEVDIILKEYKGKEANLFALLERSQSNSKEASTRMMTSGSLGTVNKNSPQQQEQQVIIGATPPPIIQSTLQTVKDTESDIDLLKSHEGGVTKIFPLLENENQMKLGLPGTSRSDNNLSSQQQQHTPEIGIGMNSNDTQYNQVAVEESGGQFHGIPKSLLEEILKNESIYALFRNEEFFRRPNVDEKKELVSNIDHYCEEAAKAIYHADVMLLITGAGFSADSGLAVYGDVAKVKAYSELGLDYEDLCNPLWLWEDPSLFYGFWGQCFNDYRKTQPHEGYEIIARWRDIINQRNGGEVAERIRSIIKQNLRNQANSSDSDSDSCKEDDKHPYIVKDIAGAFFSFTSNVDAHGFDYFRASEIRECHGNVELWQCTEGECGGSNAIWRAPSNYSFDVNQETMRASKQQLGQRPNNELVPSPLDSNAGREIVACVGQTLGTYRQNPLKYMESLDITGKLPISNSNWNNGEQNEGKNKDGLTETDNYRWSDQWPKCALCNKNARPAILMYDDWNWKDNEAQKDRWSEWKNAVQKITLDASTSLVSPPPTLEKIEEKLSSSSNNTESKKKFRVTVLEIGCGTNVPTCRSQSECIISDLQELEIDTKLIRINPDFPFADDELISGNTISVMSYGLQALKKIDQIIQVNYITT